MKTNKILWFIFGFIVLLGLFYLSQNRDKVEIIVPSDFENESSESQEQNIQKEEALVTKKSSCEKEGGTWYEYNSSCEKNFLSKESCMSQGGEFNECNSACRHNKDAEFCTMQCVLTCTFK